MNGAVPNKQHGFPFRVTTLVILASASIISLGFGAYYRPPAVASADDSSGPPDMRRVAVPRETTPTEPAAPKRAMIEIAAAPATADGSSAPRVNVVANKSQTPLATPASLHAGQSGLRRPTITDAPRGTPSLAGPGGIVFSGRYEQVAQTKVQMQQLLTEMGWADGHVQTRLAPDGKQIGYTLNSPTDDTGTLSLLEQPQWNLAPEKMSYRDRHGQTKIMAIVSQKEILACMLQRGREFRFAEQNCSVDHLKQELAIRQNIVYWGSRADWVFPEDNIYRYNTGEFWQEMQGDDWTIKANVRPMQGIADAFVGKFSYQIGCTSACRFIVAHGIFDYFHRVRPAPAVTAQLEQMLDPRRPFLNMAPIVDRDGTFRQEGLLVDRQFDVPSGHWTPGDWGWIKNTDAQSSEELGSEGCNVIYAGGGMFVNYYPERPPKTLDESIKRVYGWRFGIEEGDLQLSPEIAEKLRRDPRDGGMLRDVRDVPKLFGSSPQLGPRA